MTLGLEAAFYSWALIVVALVLLSGALGLLISEIRADDRREDD